MEKLKLYLKSLSAEEKEAFEKRSNTTINYLRKAISSKSLLGEQTCVAIEEASNKFISRKDLRPNDWHRSWPELRG